MIYDESGPIVVLSPHLDDAALSCFRVLTSGDTVAVVNLFAGVPEKGTPTGVWGRLCGFEDAHALGEARIREDVAALSSIGIAPVYLGFPENSVRDVLDEPTPSLDRILSEIEQIYPRARLVLAPLGGADRPHPDHVLARSAAIRLLYEGMPVALYADFPHVCKARRGWPEELVGRPPGISTATISPRWISRLPREVPEIDPLFNATVWTLRDGARAAKLATMKRYETQFSALDRKLRTKGIVSDPSLYGVEVAVPLVAR